MGELTKHDAERWSICRQVAKDGLDTYWEVGRALLEIKESRLYRAEFATFEAYCEQELKCTKTYANYMVQGVKVLASITPKNDNPGCQKQPILPSSTKQTRELAKAAPEDRSELWGDAVEAAGDGPVTAKHVKAAVDAKKPKPLGRVEQSMADASAAIKPIMADIQAIRRRCKELCDSGVAPYCHKQRLDGDLKNAWNGLNLSKPYAKCPGCGGTGRKTCKQCRGIGWVGKVSYKQSPRELRAAVHEA